MRQYFPAAVAITGVALTVSACGALDWGTGTGPVDAAAQKPAACEESSPYLAVALPNLTNPYYVAMRKGFLDTGREKGFNVEVQIANDDDHNQLIQVQAMLQKKPCALALNPVKSEPAAAIVKAANDAGVPVFTVNVGVDEKALTSQAASVVQYLGADNVAGGQQIAKQVLADLGAQAPMTIGFVTEPQETPTQQRDRGFEQAIGADPNAKIVARVNGHVKPDESLRATTEMLSGHPDINVIFASTGPSVYGAVHALGSNNTKVKVYGFCAADLTLTPQYPACVAQEPELYGGEVVGQIRSWLDGQNPQPEILKALKLFTNGQTPAPGEVG